MNLVTTLVLVSVHPHRSLNVAALEPAPLPRLHDRSVRNVNHCQSRTDMFMYIVLFLQLCSVHIVVHRPWSVGAINYSPVQLH